jgi:hypothetical protein
MKKTPSPQGGAARARASSARPARRRRGSVAPPAWEQERSITREEIGQLSLPGVSLAEPGDFDPVAPAAEAPRPIFLGPPRRGVIGSSSTALLMSGAGGRWGATGGSSSLLSGVDLGQHAGKDGAGRDGVGAGGGKGGGKQGAEPPVVYAFDEIVDRDLDEIYETYMNDQLVGRLLESTVFRLTILLIIVLNSITVGIQTDERMERTLSAYWDAADNIFLTIFVVEILLKWYHGFFSFWRVGWNVFDFVIVAVSILGSGVSFVSSGRVLRILRVLRAFRSLRSISALQGLQVIVQTVLTSVPDMGNILMLLGIVAFIFSVIGISIFGTALPQHFGDLGVAMFTLFIAVTQDGWYDVFLDAEEAGLLRGDSFFFFFHFFSRFFFLFIFHFHPLNYSSHLLSPSLTTHLKRNHTPPPPKKKNPQRSYVSAAIFFSIFIVLGAFVFANLISGVVVTNIQGAYHEAKLARRAANRKLRSHHLAQAPDERLWAPLKDVPLSVWEAQEPLEVPDFRGLTVDRLQSYLLVLAAQEDNLRERTELRSRLADIVRDVREVNDTRFLSSDSEDDSYGFSDDSGDSAAGHGVACAAPFFFFFFFLNFSFTISIFFSHFSPSKF